MALPPMSTITIHIVGDGIVEISEEEVVERKVVPDFCDNNSTPCIFERDHGFYFLTATPEAGWEFSGWSGQTISIAKADHNSNPELYIYHEHNRTVTATFTAIEYELNTFAESPGGGSVNAVPQKDTYNYGDFVELTAAPNPGFLFSHWSGNFTEVVELTKSNMSDNNPITIIIQGDTDITANFTQLQAVPLSKWAILLGMAMMLAFIVYRFRV